MASGKDTQATFSIVLDGNVSEHAKSDADALEAMRSKIAESQAAIKGYGTSLRNLRGSSEEVKKAKDELKARIDQERQAVSAVTLEMLKSGNAYDKTASSAKKLATENKALASSTKADTQKAMGAALKMVGGPAEEVTNKISSLKEAFGGVGGSAAIAVGAFALVAAAIVAVTAAAVAGAIAIGKWVIESANAARTQGLVLEAITGSAESAKNWGNQIDALSYKVSISRDKLSEMTAGIAKTRLGGQAMVDTLNAVAQASDAMGDEVGNRFKDIITRGQLMGRMGLGKFELMGTGLEHKDVAAALAKNTKKSIEETTLALQQGRVSIDAGAKALRDAIENRFGAVNARKALDFNHIISNMHDNFVRLTKDVNLEPLLKFFDDISKDFSDTTTTGEALKGLITDIGSGISEAFGGSSSKTVHEMIESLVIGAQNIEIAWLDLRLSLKKVFGKDLLSGPTLFHEALKPLIFTANVLGDSIERLGKVMTLFRKVADVDWKKLGSSIATGVGSGISTDRAVVNAVSGMVDDSKKTFTTKAEVHSPSKLFARYGENISEGVAVGVDRGAPSAQKAVSDMVPSPPSRTSLGPSSMNAGQYAPAGGGVVWHVHFHAEPGASAESVQALKDAAPGLKTQFTKMLEDMMAQNGAGAAGAH